MPQRCHRARTASRGCRSVRCIVHHLYHLCKCLAGQQAEAILYSSLSSDKSLWPRPLQAQQWLCKVLLVQDTVFNRCVVHTCNLMQSNVAGLHHCRSPRCMDSLQCVLRGAVCMTHAVRTARHHAAGNTAACRFPGSNEDRSTVAVVGSTAKCRLGLTLMSRQHHNRCTSCRNSDIKCSYSVTYTQASLCHRRHNKALHHQGIQAAHNARLSALLLVALI